MVFKSSQLTEGAVLVQSEFVSEFEVLFVTERFLEVFMLAWCLLSVDLQLSVQGGVGGKLLSAEFIMVWLLACLDLLVSLQI